VSTKTVLFVTLDQWRGTALSAYGHPCARTPNLDRLAQEGVSFRNHFGQASPCGPARASLLTGLYAMNHRSVRNGTPLDGRFTNLALEARRLGFAPTLFGYTDTTPDPRTRVEGDPARETYEGMLPGFDAGCIMAEVSWPWLAHLKAKGYDLPEDPADVYRPMDGGAGFAGPEIHAPRPLYAAEDSDTVWNAVSLSSTLRARCMRRKTATRRSRPTGCWSGSARARARAGSPTSATCARTPR